MLNRRSLITGLISLVAAPAIVRAANIMPVKKYGGIITPPIDGVLTVSDVEWTVTPPNSKWHMRFWSSGRNWKMGEEVDICGQRFAIDGIETVVNGTGKVWQHITGRA